MSPVTPAEVRIVDEQFEKLEKHQEHQNSRAVMHLIRIVRLMWDILKREHGWR